MMRPRRRTSNVSGVPLLSATLMAVSPAVGRVALATWCLGAVGAIAEVIRRELAARWPLRRCPVCAGVAVRQVRFDHVDPTQVRVGVECGQCATWRRMTTTVAVAQRQTNQLRRDRRLIGDRAAALAIRRRRREFDEFNALLRSHIHGAEDFLAHTRGLQPTAHRRRTP
jgi:hypothetical protein